MHEMEEKNIVNRTYLVRRLLCLAKALLSTSGGILFATVSWECTRKARAPGVLGTSRRAGGCAGEEKDGSGEECDMIDYSATAAPKIAKNERSIGKQVTKWKNMRGNLWQEAIGRVGASKQSPCSMSRIAAHRLPAFRRNTRSMPFHTSQHLSELLYTT